MAGNIGPLCLKLTADAGPLSRDLRAAQDKIAQASTAMANVPAPKLPFGGAIQSAQDRIAQLNGTIAKAFANVPGGQAITGVLTSITGAASGVLSAFSSIGGVLAANPWAVAAVGIGAVAAGLGFLAYSGFQSITALKDFSEVLGLSAGAAAGLSFAFARIGLEDRAESSLTKFTQKLGELKSNPAGELGQTLRNVGIDAASLADMPVDQALAAVADKFAMLDSAADRARLGQQLFGRDWVSMRELLSQGSAGLQQAADRAQQLGIVLSQVDMDSVDSAAKSATKAWAALGTIWTSTANTVAVAIAPAVSAAGGMIERLIIAAQPLLGVFRDVFGGVAATVGIAVQLVVGAINVMMPVFSLAAQAIGVLWDALKVVAVVAAVVFAPAILLAAAAALSLIPAMVATGLSVLAGFVGPLIAASVTILTTFIPAAVAAAVGLWTTLIPALWAAAVPLLPFIGVAAAVVAVLWLLWPVIRVVAEALGNLFGGAISVVVGAVSTLFSALRELASQIPIIGSAFSSVSTSAGAAAASIDEVHKRVAAAAAASPQIAADIRAATAGAALAADVDRMSGQWAEQATFFGLAGRELEFMRLAMQGANEAQLAQLSAQNDVLTALENEAALRDRIAKTIEATRSPLDSFRMRFTDLQEQLAGGLDRGAFASSLLVEIDKLEKAAGIGEVKAPAALAENSAAAVSAVTRAQMQATQPTDPAERLRAAVEALRIQGDVQTDIQRRTLEAIERGGFEVINNL